MTNWKAGDPPPMASVSDAKGEMRVEVRYVAPSTSIDTEAEADG